MKRRLTEEGRVKQLTDKLSIFLIDDASWSRCVPMTFQVETDHDTTSFISFRKVEQTESTCKPLCLS